MSDWAGTGTQIPSTPAPSPPSLVARVRSIINEPAALTVTDDEITRYLNDGQRDIASKGLCIEDVQVFSTTPGDRKVSFTGFKCNFVSYNKALARIYPHMMGHVPTSGKNDPQYWFQWGESDIYIDPVPTQSYSLTLYVSKYLGTEMVVLGDAPTIPLEFQELIIFYAMMKINLKARQFTRAGEFYGSYVGLLERAKQMFVIKRAQVSDDFLVPDNIIVKQEGGG